MSVTDFNLDNLLFSAQEHDGMAILKFKERPMDRIADLGVKDKLFEYLDRVSESHDIKVLVILGPAKTMERDEFTAFYRRLLQQDSQRISLERMYNMVSQFILELAGLEKPVIFAGSGKMILLFLNISLACDFRIIADNTVFQNPNVDIGLVPRGGSGFFLSKILGVREASRILLSGRDISATEALNLGIVDAVVPFEELAQAAEKMARSVSEKPTSYVVGIKKLMNFDINELRRYFEYEKSVLQKGIRSHESTRPSVLSFHDVKNVV